VSKTRGRGGRGWQACRLLLRYAAPGWKGWAFIVALTALSSACSLLQPWPMKVLVDQVLGPELPGPVLGLLPGVGSARGLLAWVVLAGLLLFAVTALVDVLLTRAWVRVGQQTVYDLAGDLFAHLQRRSLLFHSRTPVGDSLSRITGDSWCIYKLVDALLFTPAMALALTAGMVVLMLSLDLGLTLLALAVAPFMAGSSLLLRGPLRAAARARRQIEARLQSHVQRVLGGVPVVQSFTQEGRELQGFRGLTEEALRAQRRSLLRNSLSGLASGLIATVGTGVVLWVGARHVLAGTLTLGSLLLFLSYLGSLQAQLKALTALHASLQEVGAGAERVLEVLGESPEVADAPGAVALPAARGHVRLEGVTFGYEPGRPVLRGVCLEALPGQTIALVGHTGAGKTTLVSLLPRFFDPWEGHVRIDGHDLRDVQVHSLRAQVGIVLQETFLFPYTIAENIAYGRPGASRAEIEEAARAANLHDFIARLPEGYDTVLGERGATLSGGERQRLSIARALLKNAPILILDEPTSAVDALTERLLLEALGRLMKRRTTFLIAHRLSTVRGADRILVLRDGAVVEAGTHPELLARQGVYARLQRLQSGHHPEPAFQVR
jgi:ATP-binding cassette subfamily B protein/subfamily B ATP-binding cassette protein MsbA